jgi:hypothetical protein
MAKLTTREWIPYSDGPIVKQSPEIDAVVSSFSGFSTNDKPLEKSFVIDELVASFGGLSAFDNSSEKVTADMTDVINAFGGLLNKERSQRSEIPKSSSEVDDLAACFGNLSVNEPRLRSCCKFSFPSIFNTSCQLLSIFARSVGNSKIGDNIIPPSTQFKG